MRKLIYYIGTTLDGYAAGPGGEIDFYPVSADHLAHMVEAYPEVLPTHVRAELGVDAPNRRFDTIIQGRATYAPGEAFRCSPATSCRNVSADRPAHVRQRRGRAQLRAY